LQFAVFASGGMAQPSGLLAIAPYAIILGIFYFLILLPMNKRQKKVQEFQESLKVGDKVITTSGIYGQVTRVNDKSVQLQVAERVRVEFARTAIGGYQGQDPVVAEGNNL
jgi:preprotein translocase subunit YajC